MVAWMITPSIRWIQRTRTDVPVPEGLTGGMKDVYPVEKVLQQAWTNQDTGEIRWEDVETFDEENDQ